MTALKTYKRKPAPTLQQSGQVGHMAILPGQTLGTPVHKTESKILTNYIADELQQLENTLAIHGQATTSIEGGVTTIKQDIIDITNTTGANTAAISQEAITRTSADSALASLVTTLTATVATGDSTNAASISNEATARANADSALATTVSNLTATVTSGDSTNAAAITSEQTARANADSALATDITSLTAAVTSGDSTNASAITSEATARANADTALASDITSLTATVTNTNNTLSAAVTSEATARANADTANASTINTVSASVTTEANTRAAADTTEANTRAAADTTEANARIAADNTITASVTTEASVRAAADNTLLAKYGVTLNSNGYVTGFSQNNNGTTGTFKILADKFTIIDPADSAGEAGTQVFDITGGNVTMDAAHIKDLSVSTLKIQNNAVSVSTFAKNSLQTGLSNKTFSTTVSMPSAGTITVICKAGVFGSGSFSTVSLNLTIDGTTQDSLNAQGTPALANHLLLGSKDVSSGNRVINVNYTNLGNTNNPSQKADFIILRRFK